MPNKEFITPQDVRQELNLLESLTSEVSSDDEYLNAILHNQRIVGMLALSMMEGDGIKSDLKGRDESGGGDGVDYDNLPNGYIGVSMDDLSAGESGDGIFPVMGSFIHTGTDASSSIERGEAVEVIGEENFVRPLPDVDIRQLGISVSAEKTAYYDVGITGTNEPVDSSDTLEIDYIVTNTGDVADLQDVELVIGNSVEDTRTGVALNPGDAITGTLSWNIDKEGSLQGEVRTDNDEEGFTIDVEESTTSTQYLVNITGVS